MSEHQSNFSSGKTQTKLQICLLATQQLLVESIAKLVNGDCYELKCFDVIEDLIDFAIEHYEQIDCLLLSANERLKSGIKQLWQAEILLPTVILEAKSIDLALETDTLPDSLSILEISNVYHEAEIRLYLTQLKEINSYIQLAINKFITLAAENKSDRVTPLEIATAGVKKSLIAQQRRLTNKLKQRLSCTGFFYKRNPESFWVNLAPPQQQELNEQISQSYRQILLSYFQEDLPIDSLIDEFVDLAFFADISTSQILEMHMELIDDFAYQLKIEGRNDDILLDYRLPLIDIVSHLCEMYRRSLPKSNASMNLLFAVE